jgi:hypothetical protein
VQLAISEQKDGKQIFNNATLKGIKTNKSGGSIFLLKTKKLLVWRRNNGNLKNYQLTTNNYQLKNGTFK